MSKRFLEYHILRSEADYILPHLRSRAIVSVMENHGRERRIRAFGVSAFREVILANGQTLNDALHPPDSPRSGRWADLGFRAFYSTKDALDRSLDSHNYGGKDGPIEGAGKSKGRPRGRVLKSKLKPSLQRIERKAVSRIERSNDDLDSPETSSKIPKPKVFRYPNDVQNRGRPRKYIQVVNEEGRINKRVIGSIYATSDLPSCLIYVKSENKLVLPPVGYTGVGKPPSLSKEDIQEGKPPEWYQNYPAHIAAVNTKSKPRIPLKTDAKRKKNKPREGRVTPSRRSKRAVLKIFPRDETTSEDDLQDDVAYGEEEDELSDSEENGSAGSGLSTVEDPPEVFTRPSVGDLDAEDLPIQSAITDASSAHRPNDGRNDSVLTKKSSLKRKRQSDLNTPLAGISELDASDDLRGVDNSFNVPSTPGRGVGKNAGPAQTSKISDKDIIASEQTIRRSSRRKSAATSTAPSAYVEPLGSEARVAAKSNQPEPDEYLMSLPQDQSDQSQAFRIAGFDKSLPDSVPMQTGLQHAGPPVQMGNNAPEVSVWPRRGRKRKAIERYSDAVTSIDSVTIESTASVSGPTTSAQNLVKQSDARRPVAVEEELNDYRGSSEIQTLVSTPSGIEPGRPKQSGHALPFVQAPATFPSSPSHSAVEDLQETPNLAITIEDVRQTASELPNDSERASKKWKGRKADTQLKATNLEPKDMLVSQPEKETESQPVDALLTSSPESREVPSVLTAGQTTLATDELHTRPSGLFRSEVADLSGTSTRISTYDRTAESTPLIQTVSKVEASPGDLHGRGRARPEFSFMLRVNELCQLLSETGGVLSDSKLLHAYRAWVSGGQGTNAPFAPLASSCLDRSVFKRTIRAIIDSGRLKETIASIPTTTGRWLSTSVLYLPETSQAEVQNYIRSLNDLTQQAFSIRSAPAAKISATQFTEVRLPNSRTGLKGASSSQQRASLVTAQSQLSSEDRRATLLKDPNVISDLYGFKSGRCLRVQTFHLAVMKALVANPNSISLVSPTAPRIIALPLLFEDIAVSDWYACITTVGYDEALERFLADPQSRTTKLRNVPKHIVPDGGFSGKRGSWKMKALLTLMCELKLITPLAAVSEAEATVRCMPQNGATFDCFHPTDSSTLASHYLVHEVAPVYHIAAEAIGLLGILPVSTVDQADRYWATVKDACLQRNINRLPSLHSTVLKDPLAMAPLTPKLDVSSELLKTLRSISAWRHDIRLVPAQRAALSSAAQLRTEGREMTESDLHKLMFEFALSRDTVETHFQHRDQVHRAKEAAESTRERQELSERTLRQKIAQRHEQSKQAWEESVRASAERVGTIFQPTLVDFVRRHTQFTTQGTELSKAQLDRIVNLFERSRSESGLSLVQTRAPRVRRSQTSKDIGVRPTRGKPSCSSVTFPSPLIRDIVPTGRIVRRRKNWTHENDETLIDAEAILRARAQGRPNPSRAGRAAAVQIFPDVMPHMINSRIKKLLALPGKEGYIERLEHAWNEIWIEHRGTETLPDTDPQNMTEFDLAAHIRFLRERIVKFKM